MPTNDKRPKLRHTWEINPRTRVKPNKKKDWIPVIDDNGYPSYDFKVGDTVKDDLTRKITTIKRIEHDKHGNSGIWLVDSSYLEGARHPWELTKIEKYDDWKKRVKND